MLRGNQRPPGETKYHARSIDAPAQTITSQAGLFRFAERPSMLRSQYGAGGDSDARGERRVDEPASTITSKAGSLKWVSDAELRPELRDWEWLDAPATTIAADPRIGSREHHEQGEQFKNGLRLSHLEAAALQSFPPDMVLPGNQGEKFLAIGNAVPPLMAAAILGALLAPPAERDAWDHVFAGVAG